MLWFIVGFSLGSNSGFCGLGFWVCFRSSGLRVVGSGCRLWGDTLKASPLIPLHRGRCCKVNGICLSVGLLDSP